MNTNMNPRVSCITSVTDDNMALLKAVSIFVNQEYPNLELIIVKSGGISVGELLPDYEGLHYIYRRKRLSQDEMFNLACEKAAGEIILHLDEGCWYSKTWVSRQVNALMGSKADICGLNKENGLPISFDMEEKNPEQVTCWILASTLCYWKSVWTNYPFRKGDQDTTTDFVLNAGAGIYVHSNSEGYLGAQIFIPIPNKRTMFPLVSCIMMTKDLKTFHTYTIKLFLAQDYDNLELIILDDGKSAAPELISSYKKLKYFYIDSKMSTGAKKNMACGMARGSLILHWNDQDWYADDWIKYQVSSLLTSGADISGLNLVRIYALDDRRFITNKNVEKNNSWLYGATMIYKKPVWENNKFLEVHCGEDEDFLSQSGAKIFAHKYLDGFNTNIHVKELEDMPPGNDHPSLN
ncbi:glycosyltransferase family 2 protein [Pedobacter caeni]|uniref:Glycosyl transferase family 2 n=1 Tax=Pedobacter caeni TaxID=288992 RepID=A0A1M5H4Q2_9SPHI|nr:glycosyltransferase [Pedobacter caeni]SHG10863.1 Glycosyl transferase family 2 [Pedobacter caeni]